MIDQVAIVAYQKRVRKIGLLASPTTIKSGLYNAACASFGITVVVPSSEQLNTIEAAIRAVIACTDIHPYQQALRDIAATLIGRGAELIVLGCTELPIAYGETSDETTVSSLRVLSDAVLKQYYEG
jgi:aspartate racemase